MSIRNILFLFSLMMILSSPSYAGFWDFLKKKKPESTETTQIETPKEESIAPVESDTAAESEKEAEAAKATADASKKAEAEKASADAAKKAEAEKASADASKKAEADKASADTAKKAEADKASADAAKKAEADKAAADAAKKVEADKAAADAVKKTEADKASADAAKKAEADKASADASKKAEADKAVTDAAKKAEADKASADAAKKAEADKAAADAAKKAEADKAVADAAKKAEADKAVADAAKKAEADKAAADAAKKAEAGKAAADAAKKAEAGKAAADAAKKAEADKAAADAAKKAEADKAAADAAKKAEADKAAADAAKKAEADKIAAEAAKKAEAEKAAAPVAALPAAKGRLTALGAEANGNAEGTIPAATEKMNGVPAGLRYTRSGDPYPDPYANEQPLFTIHAGNMDEYANKMSDGVKALMKKFPDSFVMNVYKSHRDAKIDDLIIQRSTWNSSKTKLVGLDGLENYTGGIPFIAPKSGVEVMWNARVAHPHPTLNGTMDDMAVYLNGNNQLRRSIYTAEFPFSYRANALGQVDNKIGINAAFVHVTIEKPDRQKGQMTIIHEALDQVKGERKAWVYIPGSRRVRRAPTVGFDTPDGPGGLVTVDDSLGFNGAMVRYNWTLVGKKEMYIPYHNYKFDDNKVDYATLLGEGHANPDYMRYELHRVWIVEATLKSGQRHVYAKRRFYVDEDSWQFVLVDSYDGRGNLWRVGILNSLYDYILKAYIARAQVYHDLQSGAYIAQRLVNETGQMQLMDTPKGENYYTPANLRTMGK